MTIKIKVSAGFSGVLPTGSYQNSRPSFAADVEMELKEGVSVGESIDKLQDVLHKICYDKFQSVAEQARIDLVKSQKANIRFSTIKDENGNDIQVPSVSSIANYDKTFDLPPEELQQYASQGNLADAQGRWYIQTGVWETDLTKIPNTFTDLAILKKGNLRLSPLVWNFPAFLEKHKISGMVEGKKCWSVKHRFAGTPDIQSLIWEGKKTLGDWKRTPSKEHFRQLGGYVIALEEMNPNEPPYEALMLIGVNPDNQQGFSKPMTTTEVAQCKDMFLAARKEFYKLYLV
jgi:hypothetical protein